MPTAQSGKPGRVLDDAIKLRLETLALLGYLSSEVHDEFPSKPLWICRHSSNGSGLAF